MNKWKLVPVEPTGTILDVLHDNWIDEYGELLVDVYQAILAAAPTPPVVLPPHDKWAEPWLHEYAEKYARAALAQYGITDQPERRQQEVGEGQPETTVAEQRVSAEDGIPSGTRAPAAPTIHGSKEMTYEQLKLIKRLIEETIAIQNRYDTQARYRANEIFKKLGKTIDKPNKEKSNDF